MRHVRLALLIALVASSANASYLAQDRIRAVILATFGWDWAQVMKSQNVLLNYQDPEPDYFGGGTKTNSQPMVGGALGIDFPTRYIGSRWQMTVAYYQSNNFEASGTDYFYSLRNYGNKSFTYSVNSQRAMFENKLMFDLSEQLYGTHFFAYVMLGIGAAINKAYGYSEQAIQPETTATGEFASQTNTSFTYSAGVGLEYAFSTKYRLGLGYRFMDLGKVSLGQYSYADTNNTITNDNMLAQELLAQLSILF